MKYDPISVEYTYKAFISYRHVPRDIAAAKALHTQIERYTVPTGRKDAASRSYKKWKVFRDEEELRITNDLPQSIHEALDASEYLIVICSPESMNSRWVPREIAYFLKHHDQEHILTVVTAGDPGQMLPVILDRVSAEGYDTSLMKEPLFLDIRADNSRNMKRLLKAQFLKLAATLHGCAYDDLVMRDQRHRKQRMLLWSIGISCIAAVIIGILLWSNKKIDEKNKELEKQYNEILMRESELLSQEALEALDEGDWVSAISYALSALPNADSDRPYNATAEQALLSAIRPLDYPERPLILQNTVLSQTTRIDAYCINSDGSRLVTVDWYGFLTCFDTVSGQILWTLKIDPISESYTISLVNYAPENTILILHDSGVCSVSWENGEIRWHTNYNIDIHVIASDQGNCLAVVHHAYYYVESEGNWPSACNRIDFLSPVNGCINASTDLYVDYNTLWAFSADGNSLAGVYRNYDTGGALTCIMVNSQTGSYDSIVCPDRGNERTNVSIQFTPDDKGLLFLYYTESEEDDYWVDLYDLSTQSFIWSTSIQGTDDSEYTSNWEDAPLAYFFPEYILLSEDSELHLLDIHSGEYLCSAKTEYIVEDIAVLSDTIFGYVMNNGGYVLGYLSDTLISRSDFDAYSVSYDLNTDGSCSLWNGGFFFDEIGLDGYTVGSEKDGLGYAVVLSPDGMDLTIIRPYRHAHDFGQICGEEYDFLCRTEIIPYGEDIIVGLFADYRNDEITPFYCYLIDRDTMEIKQTFDVSNNTEVHFLADGSGYLRWDNDLEITHVDPVSGKETPVLDPNDRFCFSRGGTDITVSPMMEKTARMTATDDFWTVALTEVGIVSWTNGAQMTQIPYPNGIDLTEKTCPYSDIYQAELLESGHLMVSFKRKVGIKPDTYLYDRNGDSWYFWSDANEQSCALHHPWLAEVGEDKTIIIRDYSTGQIITEIQSALPGHIIDQISFVLEDQYLLVTTDENLLKLYDLTTAEEVFSYQGYYLSAYRAYICKADSQNQRVYLYMDENGYYDEGLCIDMRSWTLLTQIDEMAYFDPGSGILVRSPYMPESGYHFMMGRLPSTEELIAYGREILTQQNFS